MRTEICPDGPVGRFIYRGVFPYSEGMEFNPGTFQRNFKIWDAQSFVVSIVSLLSVL